MGQARDASPQGLGSAPCPSPQISDGQVRSGLPSWEMPQAKTALGSGAQDSPLPPPPVTEAAGEREHLLLHPGAVVRGLAVPDSSLRLESPFLAPPCAPAPGPGLAAERRALYQR